MLSIPAKNTDIGSSTRRNLLAFYEDSQKLNHLKIELPLTCYETIQEVKFAIQVGNIPNVQAIARSISPSSAVQQQLIAHVKNVSNQYFNQKLSWSLKVSLTAIKAS